MKNKKLFAILTLVCFMFTFMPVAAMAGEESAVTEVNTYEALLEALENGNANIKMTANITADATQSSGYGKAGIVLEAGDVLDGDGHTLTINGANGTWDCAIAMKGGEVKNLTIAGAMRGVFMPGANGNVVIDTCVFKDVIYTFNSDAGSKDYSVTIKNSVLNGWTSFSDVHKSVTFENCKFGEGSGYAFCRPYQATTFLGCEFEEGFELDTEKVTANSHIFNDCIYNDEPLSSANNMFGGETTVIIDGVPSNAVAKIDDETYTSLVDAFQAAQENDEIVLVSDVTVSDKWDCRYNGAKFIVPVTIDGNGHAIKITGTVDDKNWDTVLRFEANATVKNLIIDASEANDIQRGISSKMSITVDNCTFIGNGTSAKRAIIFGEGAGNALCDVTANISNSTFKNWSYGVSDNQSGKDAKSVNITDSSFENSSVLVSASENVTFTGNTIDNGYVNISSYSIPNELAVTATGNTLDSEYAEYNILKASTINAQDDFVIKAIATVGDKYYNDLQEAIKAAAPSGTVEIIKDVTVDEWVMFAQNLTIGNDNLITLNMDGLTINGNGHALTINSIESASNGDRLFQEAENLNIKNLTIEYANDVAGGISLQSGTIENVTFNGGTYGVLPGDGEVTIEGCTFKTNGTAIYYEEERDNLVVNNNTFELSDNINVILLRGDTEFTNNIIISGRTVNVVSGSPVVIGNDFGDVRFKVYNDAAATIENNVINTLAFEDENKGAGIDSIFSNNTLSDAATALLAEVGYKATVTYTDGVEGETLFSDQIVKATPGSNTPAFDGTPKRDGYTFNGWCPEVAEKVSDDVTYVAQWNRNTSSSGGGFSGVYNYPVNIGDVDGADVTLSDNYATKGETVTITIDPDMGKKVDEVIVTDADGDIIPVTKVGDNKYTFVMPAGKVNVSVITENADYDQRIVLQINNKNIVNNNKTITNDVAPVIVGDRTLVPVRIVTELLGGTADWDEATRTVTLTIDGKVLKLVIGEEIPGYGTGATIINDRTYVPIRYISEMLGAQVEWIANTQQIIIEK